MTLAAFVLAMTLLAAVSVAGGVVVRVVRGSRDEIVRALTSPEAGPDREWIDSVDARLAALDDLVDRLPAKWAEFEERTRAAEERTRGRIRRAVESIEGGDASGWDVLASEGRKAGMGHGAGSPQGELLPVREGVADVPPETEPESEDQWISLANRYKFANG